MDDPLRTYLHDHLAGASFAVELLETLHQRHPDHPTGILAGELLKEVSDDRLILESLIEKVGRAHLDLKDAAAWLAERASRAKLGHHHPTDIGTFEAFEALSLGIVGKLALWRVLPEIAAYDPRVAGPDYATLAIRAQAQFAKAEDYRLRLAPTAFDPRPQLEWSGGRAS